MTVYKGTLFKDELTTIQYYRVDSTKPHSLTNDLGNVFGEISNEFPCKADELLIYIDGTNGNFSICSYDFSTRETIDDYFVSIIVKELWEDNQNGYEFNDISETCITSALKIPTGRELLKKYNVFLQGELGEAKQLK